MITFKHNIKDIAKALASDDKKIAVAIEDGMYKGMRAFESKMIKEQFTGRPGLKRISGYAANNWFTRTEGTGKETVVRLSNRKISWYIAVHQHHNFSGRIVPRSKKYLKFPINGKYVTVKSVFIPKRLNIFEDYNKYGPKIIVREIIKSVEKAMDK